MSDAYRKTLPARLLVLFGCCQMALAIFAQIGGLAGLALMVAGGLCALAGLVWFVILRRG